MSIKQRLHLHSNLFLTAAILLFIVTSTYGQEKKTDVLDKVKGKVQKISIQTDKGIVTYEGGEAQALFDRLKTSPEVTRVKIFRSGKDENGEPEIIMLNPAKIGKNFKFFSEDMKEGEKLKIKVENKDGQKVVTVTTTDKDGKEKTETYKGKEADEYLEKHEPKNLKKFEWMDKNNKGNVFYIRKSDKDSTDEDVDYMIWNADDSTNGFWYKFDDLGKGMKKKIKVTEENGVKKVTVTTTDKDGKEKTETFTGKEAEEYLKKHDVETKVKVEEDKNGKVKEIIIRKEKKEDNK
jgi:hypothetical protein